jgi:3,4-dihydroxy 2-butanone 4-phosphate synthase/GTP cyclohydrolase II
VSRSVLDEPIAATAAVDLAQLADLEPVVALSALVGIDNPTQLMQRDEAVTFGREHSLALIAIDSIAAQVLMSRTSSGSGPVHLQQGDFTVLHYRDPRDGMTHYAFTRGDLAQRDELAVRIHPECIAGDVLGTQDCGCRQHLQSALDDASRNEVGIVLYLRGDDPHGSMTNSDQVSERNTRIATEMLKALRIADPGRTAVLC